MIRRRLVVDGWPKDGACIYVDRTQQVGTSDRTQADWKLPEWVKQIDGNWKQEMDRWADKPEKPAESADPAYIERLKNVEFD